MPEEKDSHKTFPDIINRALLHEKDASSLAKRMGVSASIFSRWRNGKIFPSVRHFPKISEYLDTTTEGLALLNSYFHGERMVTRHMHITAENLQTVDITTEDLAFLEHVLAGTNGKLRLDIAIELLIARKLH